MHTPLFRQADTPAELADDIGASCAVFSLLFTPLADPLTHYITTLLPLPAI
jgi:hypothetical protein